MRLAYLMKKGVFSVPKGGIPNLCPIENLIFTIEKISSQSIGSWNMEEEPSTSVQREACAT